MLKLPWDLVAVIGGRKDERQAPRLKSLRQVGARPSLSRREAQCFSQDKRKPPCAMSRVGAFCHSFPGWGRCFQRIPDAIDSRSLSFRSRNQKLSKVSKSPPQGGIAAGQLGAVHYWNIRDGRQFGGHPSAAETLFGFLRSWLRNLLKLLIPLENSKTGSERCF